MGDKIMQPRIAAIVMTSNEALNIGKCLESLAGCDAVFILDSNSTDGTLDIAANYKNARVMQVKWEGYAATFNRGVELAKDFDWILRIDADEELFGDIVGAIGKISDKVDGIIVRRTICFQGEPLKFGPHANAKMLRLFRSGRGGCELTNSDEHITVVGETQYFPDILVLDRDNKPFSQWLTKHVRWAKKEAASILEGGRTAASDNVDSHNKAKRVMKMSVYYRAPPYLRAMLYFLYRFIICRECLGGLNGISWCVIQGLWYRLLIDFYILFPENIDERL